jgi:hypothetical protein
VTGQTRQQISQIWGLMDDGRVTRMVHDAVSCDRTKTRPFPTQMRRQEHVRASSTLCCALAAKISAQ